MQAERIPLSRSEMLEMVRWIRKGWLPDESAVERIRDSLFAVVMDPKTEGRGRDRARVRAARVLLEMEIADVKRHNAAAAALVEFTHDRPIDLTFDRLDAI